MKKVISILLVLVMALSLCACGETITSGASSNSVKSRVVVNGETFSISDFKNLVKDNNYKFEKTYVGQTATVTGKVTKIDGAMRHGNLNVYLDAVIVVENTWYFEVNSDNSILNTLNVDDVVTITGTISTDLYGDVYCYGNATVHIE